MPFGGAGPMHAAALAFELGMDRILCPRASGVLSALGLTASDRRRDTARTVLLSGSELTAERIAAEVSALRESIGAGLEGATEEATYELRYRGQAFELAIAGPSDADPAELAERFGAEHERRYGYREPDGRGRAGQRPPRAQRRRAGAEGRRPRRPAARGAERRQARFDGEWLDTRGPDRRALRPAPRALGPCVFELGEATFVLPPGWRAESTSTGRSTAGRRPDELARPGRPFRS